MRLIADFIALAGVGVAATGMWWLSPGACLAAGGVGMLWVGIRINRRLAASSVNTGDDE